MVSEELDEFERAMSEYIESRDRRFMAYCKVIGATTVALTATMIWVIVND